VIPTIQGSFTKLLQDLEKNHQHLHLMIYLMVSEQHIFMEQYLMGMMCI
jgi:hypothetical protein